MFYFIVKILNIIKVLRFFHYKNKYSVTQINKSKSVKYFIIFLTDCLHGI